MANGPITVDENFGANLARGASIGNMQVMQAERAQQLRSEEALRMVQERHLAAQADQLAYNLQQAQAEKAKEDQDLQTADLIHHTMTETTDATPEQATQATDQWLINRNPKAAMKIGQARFLMSKPELAQEALQTKENVAQTQAAGAMARTQAQQAGALQRTQLRVQSPHLDAFTQSLGDYQKALESGDDEKASMLKARLQKLSGQLPSAAMREGEDLATVKDKLATLTQKMNSLPEVDPADEAQRQHYQNIVDSMESRHGQEEISVATPGGPEVRITKGGKKEPGALTPAETTRYGEDIQATSNALRNLNRLRSQLGAGTVGAGPVVESFIFDKVLSQLGADVSDKARVAGRQNIRLSTQQVLGELNNRGRLSNQELNAIKDAMPSLGMAESDPNAKVKLDELRLMLAEKGASAATTIKRPVSDEILQTLAHLFPPGAEGERAMAAEVRNGSLNRDVALQVRKWQKSKGQ
jgi:hypothetical protein